jgi:hypothetical protein
MVQAPSPTRFLIVALAASFTRQQEAFIAYLKAENRILKARLGRQRIIFSDAGRRLLARPCREESSRLGQPAHQRRTAFSSSVWPGGPTNPEHVIELPFEVKT